MGAEAWSYFIPYHDDVATALEELKQKEFAAGRYHKPWGFRGTHASIQEALEGSGVDGTRSILDMERVAESPHNPDWHGEYEYQADPRSGDVKLGELAPLTAPQLARLFGTDRPTHAEVEANEEIYNYLDRGLGLYIVVYDGDEPTELFLAGYSFD